MAHTAVAKKQSEPKMSRALVRQETIAGYLFLLPSLIFFIGFVIYPMVMCIFTSFFDSSMNRADVFIGLQNYVELFHDSVFLGALRNTLIIVVVSVPITCIFSLWVASAIVNMPPWATSLFRVIFYLPVVTGSVAVTVVWKWMFNNYYGIFNYLGKSMGLLDQNINWLGDTRYALACIILTAGIAMFPFVMPSSTMMNASLTMWDATSSQLTLNVMTWVAVVLVPIILLYTAWCYWKMFGRITKEDIERNTHSLY